MYSVAEKSREEASAAIVNKDKELRENLARWREQKRGCAFQLQGANETIKHLQMQVAEGTNSLR